MAYRVVALLIAAEAVVQSVAVGYFVGVLNRWIDTEGAVGVADRSALHALPGEGPVVALDRVVLQSADQWSAGGVGLTIATVSEVWVAPVLAVALLILAYRSRIPSAVPVAAVVAAAVGVQWLTGWAAGSVPALAALHELAAFAVFGAALWAAGFLRRRPAATGEGARRVALRRAYRTLAGLVSGGLLVQALALAAVVAGVAAYVADSRAEIYDSMLTQPEQWADAGFGYPVHVLTGILVLPLLALLLMAAAPLTAIPGAVWRAAVVLVAVLARGALTILAEFSPWAAAGLQLAGFAVLAAALSAAQRIPRFG
jgi:hypothetical protein